MSHGALRGARGVWAAFSAPFRAIATIAARPALWPLAAAPTVILGLFLAGGTLAARPVYDRASVALAARLGSSTWGGAGAVIGRALIVVVLGIAVLVLAAVLVPALAAPVMDALAARVDPRRSADEPLARQLARSARVGLFSVLVAGLPQIGFWLLTFFVPLLAPLWIALGIATASLGMAFDALDWPLSRRGLGAGARVDWMREHAAVTIGLGAAVWIMFWVPGLSIVLLPATVVGAVDLVNRAERG